MGCYNVAGTMSNLSIGCGDRVAYFLLVPSTNYFRRLVLGGKVGNTLSSDAGARIFYTPYCAPIFGEYNEYGGLINIERTQTVLDLESKFGISIERIFESSIDTCEPEERGMDDELYSLLCEFSGMFELKSVYDSMSEYCRIEDKLLSNNSFNDYTMEFVGFTRDPDQDKQNYRYNLAWTLDNVTVYTDGNFSERTIKISGSDIYLRSFYKLKTLDNFVKFNLIAHSVTSLYLKIKQYREVVSISEHTPLPEDADPEDILNRLVKISATDYELRKVKDNLTYIKNPELGTMAEVETLGHFDTAMFGSNNWYFPAMNGPQWGEWELEKHLNETISKRLLQINIGGDE